MDILEALDFAKNSKDELTSKNAIIVGVAHVTVREPVEFFTIQISYDPEEKVYCAYIDGGNIPDNCGYELPHYERCTETMARTLPEFARTANYQFYEIDMDSLVGYESAYTLPKLFPELSPMKHDLEKFKKNAITLITELNDRQLNNN